MRADRLEIHGYRGFGHYLIPNLARVNLLVGKNNSGKTTILEAMRIGVSQHPIQSLVASANHRREYVQLLSETGAFPSPRRVPSQVDISHSFFGHEPRADSVIQVRIDASVETAVTLEELEETPSLPFLFDEGSFPDLSLVARRGDEKVEVAYASSEGLVFESRRTPSRIVGEPGDVPFVATSGMTDRLLVVAWNRVVTMSAEDKIVRALQLLHSDIVDLKALQPDGSASRGFLAYVLVQESDGSRYPIGSYGDGMKRLLGLALLVASLRDDLLLVDEIDTGFHYSVLPEMWRLLILGATDANFQVVATTHSWDCIDGLREFLLRNPGHADTVAVHKVIAGQNEAVSFTGEDLVLALKGGVELR